MPMRIRTGNATQLTGSHNNKSNTEIPAKNEWLRRQYTQRKATAAHIVGKGIGSVTFKTFS